MLNEESRQSRRGSSQDGMAGSRLAARYAWCSDYLKFAVGGHGATTGHPPSAAARREKEAARRGAIAAVLGATRVPRSDNPSGIGAVALPKQYLTIVFGGRPTHSQDRRGRRPPATPHADVRRRRSRGCRPGRSGASCFGWLQGDGSGGARPHWRALRPGRTRRTYG